LDGLKQTTIAEQLESHKGAMGLSELAEMLNVSYDTVYKWARGYGLPATKIAGTYWVDPVLAARWWLNHSTTVPNPPTYIRRRATKRK
jgi:excisionase family DNA binding protein